MFPPQTRVFFAVQPTDLRRSFDGLAAAAQGVLGKDRRRPAGSSSSSFSRTAKAGASWPNGSTAVGSTARSSAIGCFVKRHLLN